MQYLLLVNNDPSLFPTEQAAMDEMLAGYVKFGEELASRNIEFSGNPLQFPNTATTIRIRNGKTVTTDGPFAETKEWVGGYYLVDVPNLDVALELAAKLPGARFGSIEVRPVAQMCASVAAANKQQAAVAHA